MRATPIGVNLSRHRPPARGGPTIYDGSTSDTNAAYYSRATPCGWPALVACSGGLLRWPALAVCSGGLLWRATAGGGQRRVACSGGLRRVVGLSAAPAFLCSSISVICTLATNNTPVSGGFVVRSACK